MMVHNRSTQTCYISSPTWHNKSVGVDLSSYRILLKDQYDADVPLCRKALVSPKSSQTGE